MSNDNEKYSSAEEGNESEPSFPPAPNFIPRDVCKEFIAAYRNHRILWDPSHNFYTSTYRRSKAYDDLVPILKQCIPTANQLVVRRQINALRSNYRKLHRKYLLSKTSLNGREVYLYQPRNWKYQMLKFLDNVVTRRQFDTLRESKEASDSDPDNPTEATQTQTRSSYHSPSKEPYKKRSKTKVKKVEEYNDVENEAVEIIDEAANEEFKLIGTNVALKLKRMSVDQRYHAELLINKILINALKCKLNNATDIVQLDDNDTVEIGTDFYDDVEESLAN